MGWVLKSKSSEATYCYKSYNLVKLVLVFRSHSYLRVSFRMRENDDYSRDMYELSANSHRNGNLSGSEGNTVSFDWWTKLRRYIFDVPTSTYTNLIFHELTTTYVSLNARRLFTLAPRYSFASLLQHAYILRSLSWLNHRITHSSLS